MVDGRGNSMASYKSFVISEIESMQDSYSNTEIEACEFVRELLIENEYSEVLTAQQTARALIYINNRLTKLKVK